VEILATATYRQVIGRLQGLTTAELYDARREIDKLLASHEAQVKQGKQKSKAGYQEVKIIRKKLKNGLDVEYKYLYLRWVDENGKRRSKYIGKAEPTAMAQPKKKAA
jgi:hypothetical protein